MKKATSKKEACTLEDKRQDIHVYVSRFSITFSIYLYKNKCLQIHGSKSWDNVVMKRRKILDKFCYGTLIEFHFLCAKLCNLLVSYFSSLHSSGSKFLVLFSTVMAILNSFCILF